MGLDFLASLTRSSAFDNDDRQLKRMIAAGELQADRDPTGGFLCLPLPYLRRQEPTACKRGLVFPTPSPKVR